MSCPESSDWLHFSCELSCVENMIVFRSTFRHNQSIVDHFVDVFKEKYAELLNHTEFLNIYLDFFSYSSHQIHDMMLR